MKSATPFHGVATPQMRKIAAGAMRRHPFPSAAAWQEAVRTLWRQADRREERYAAIEVLLCRAARGWLTLERLHLAEELITSGAWWDYTDAIAPHALGHLLRAYADAMAAILREWAVDADIWKRRAAILAQLKFKAETDEHLLHDLIEPSLGEREFFLRKAIGWALREYSKTAPAFVADYVERTAGRMAPLTRREAVKVLAKRGGPSRP